MIRFATLVEKMKNKLRKADYTSNVYVFKSLKIREGSKNKYVLKYKKAKIGIIYCEKIISETVFFMLKF
jgi:hypothetical protein